MKSVAETEVCMDVALLRQCGFELRAQLADVHVDGPLLLAEGPVPHDGVELLAADYAAAAARECGEQAELPHGQLDRVPVREGEVLARPDLEPALPQDLVSSRFHNGFEPDRKGRKVRYERVTDL